MNKRWTKQDIWRAALRAAAAVAAGGATAACVELDMPVVGQASAASDGATEGLALDSAAQDGVAQDGVAQDGVAQTGGADAGVALGAGQADAGVGSADAGQASADSGVAAADSGQDAQGGDVAAADHCNGIDGWERYAACCDANGWDYKKGCMAWGPPAPPAADPALLASLLQQLRADLGARGVA